MVDSKPTTNLVKKLDTATQQEILTSEPKPAALNQMNPLDRSKFTKRIAVTKVTLPVSMISEFQKTFKEH